MQVICFLCRPLTSDKQLTKTLLHCCYPIVALKKKISSAIKAPWILVLLTDSYSNWPCSLRWLQLTLFCELEISYSWMTSLQLMQDTPLFFIKWDRVKVKESEHVIRRWVWILWFYIGSYTCQPIFPYPLITTSPASLPLIFFSWISVGFSKTNLRSRCDSKKMTGTTCPSGTFDYDPGNGTVFQPFCVKGGVTCLVVGWAWLGSNWYQQK